MQPATEQFVNNSQCPCMQAIQRERLNHIRRSRTTWGDCQYTIDSQDVELKGKCVFVQREEQKPKPDSMAQHAGSACRLSWLARGH